MIVLSLLQKVNSREELCALTDEELSLYCAELRRFLIDHVSDCGGHLASNLGIVEAMVAIHRIFDTTKDRLVFDVGHQCYVHKIITGRREGFVNLRQFGGISGFPKPEESIHDAFIAGHASNSVSVALGFARARTRKNEKHHVIALIGDGALTGGLSYEGLNDAGVSGEPLIVILNDNGMSISKNVGAISGHLATLRLKPSYFGIKKLYRRAVLSLPFGKGLYRITHAVKKFLKRSLIGCTVFEDMGFTYLGPVDGHDIQKVSYLLSVAKEMNSPTLVHIVTQKGRGYEPAECDPADYHGVSHFDPNVGLDLHDKEDSYSSLFGKCLCELAEKDERICAVTAAMPLGTGLTEFSRRFPDRLYDVGIAEGHAVSLCGGLAAGGMIPVVAIYSTFLQRAFDMMVHDVALMHLHVIFAIDRSGLVGADGPTHHGVFDVAYMRLIPGMSVYSPVTQNEVNNLLQMCTLQGNGPIAIRYPRGTAPIALNPPPKSARADALIIYYGEMAGEVLPAAEALLRIGIATNVLRLLQLKPLDRRRIREAAGIAKFVFVVEDCQSIGSVGEEVAEFLSGEKKVICLNLGDRFTPHGDLASLYREANIDRESIINRVREVLSDEA